MAGLLGINMILAVLIVFFQRREPEKVWAWLLFLYFLPVTGFVGYLLFGQNFRRSRMFRAQEIDGEMEQAVRRQKAFLRKEESAFQEPGQKRYMSLVLYNLNEGRAVLTNNNDIRVYTDGRELVKEILSAIESAERYIHLEYYIIRKDEVWKEIQGALLRKVREGVEVRLLLDGVGSREHCKKELKYLQEQGICAARFFPPLLGKLHYRMNYRNHRKIIVIDGRIGFLGGFNIGKEYLGGDPRFGVWRDTHFCIEGAAVTSLAVRFALDYRCASGENLFCQDRLFLSPAYRRNGQEAVQIISSGPDSAEHIRNNYLRLIHMARRYIYIQTPYFVPDTDILNALKIAASSGVDVRLMIPSRPDHPFVYWATYSYMGELIMAGARCYVYNKGFLHAKGLVVDGEVSCYGTANMDIRSFRLNFETNAVIYGEATAKRMEKLFREDVTSSTLIHPGNYAGRPARIRMKEQFCRLLSPIL